jgi:Serine dehydrogenase proteinase
MPKANRLKLIERLQRERKSHVITYLTSTRQGLEVHMALDSIRIIFEHLCLAEPKEWGEIDLFLYSNGGDGIVPWRLVTLLREKAKRLSVLIPFRAFSAATLTALGADSVVMHPMGILGPTDPTVQSPFNPIDPANPPNRIGINVEDVTAFIALIKEDAEIHHEDELVLAFNKLADHVHPLALGSVKRFLSQSRMMARKLLSLHIDATGNQHRIDELVDSFTSKLFYHGHPINRIEARTQIGLATVEHPSLEVENLMWNLYLDYEIEMQLQEPFQPAFEFVAKTPTLQIGQQAITFPATCNLAYIESEMRTDVLKMEYELSGQRDASGVTKVQFLPRSQRWTTE